MNDVKRRNEIGVLVVEDDPALRMVVCETLELEGFKVYAAEDGMKGLVMSADENVDVIVADIMMPNLDGIGMVKRIRQRDRHILLIFLTAKSSVESVVEGFEAGGDDYLRKPFSMKELIVRIKSLHSRFSRQKESFGSGSGKLHIGAYEFDPISQYLTIGERSVELSSKESGILRMLADNVNTLVPINDIMLALWEDDSHFISNRLQVFITKLRQLLKDDPCIRIVNARGMGYKLVIDYPGAST